MPKTCTIIFLILALTFLETTHSVTSSPSFSTANLQDSFSTTPMPDDPASLISPVKETLILRNNTIVAGNYSPVNQVSFNQLYYPTAVAYASHTNHIYVTSGASLATHNSPNRIAVIDGNTNRIITELNVSDPRGLAYDPLKENMYVASAPGVTVISDTTLRVIANITLQSGSSGVAYDPANNHVYVSNYSKNIVQVIDPSTNQVTNLKVAAGPTGIAFDPDNKRLYINCMDAGTVFEINATNNAVIANVSVNTTPTRLSTLMPPLGTAIPQLPTQNIVYDSSNQRIYLISRIGPGIVSILNTVTNKVIGTVPVGPYSPFGLAYDASTHNIYATNYASRAQSQGYTSIINGTTNKIVANATVGLGPTGIAYDPQNGNMYVACARSDTVSIIHGATNKSNFFLGSQDFPMGVAYNPANHLLYVADQGSYTATLVKASISSSLLAVNTTTGKVQQIINAGIGPEAIAYNDYNKNLYVLNMWSGSVSVLNPMNEIIAQVPVPSGSLSLLYNSDNHDIYVANEESNTVSIIDSLSNTIIATLNEGKHPLGLAYDSIDNLVYITHTPLYQGPKGYASYITALDGRTNEIVANFTVGIDGGLLGIAYDPTNDNIYVADWATSSVSIIRGSDHTVIGNIQIPGGAQGLVYVPGYEKLFVTSQFTGGLGPPNARTVSIIDTRTQSLLQNFTAGYEPTGGAYDPDTGYVYISNYESGTLSVVAPEEVTDFNIVVTPPLIMLRPTIPGSATITVTGLRGFIGNITLTATSSGPTTRIGPSILTLSPDTRSASATLTLTGTHPGESTITIEAEVGSLSHSVQLTAILTQSVSVSCGSSGAYCLVTSDSILSNLGFSGNVLQFNATGLIGTAAFVNVTVPKILVANINQIRIFLDKFQLPDYEFSVITTGHNYLIQFSVAFHSSVQIQVQFGPATPTVFGIQTELFYVIAGAIVATLAGAVVVVKRRWSEISKQLISSILID